MNNLDRMMQLAGIPAKKKLTESVTAVPGIGPNAGGSDESDMQTSATGDVDNADSEFDNAQTAATESVTEAKFPNVSCSQCGQEFGPGDSGYSHCSDHKGKVAVDEGADITEEPESPPQVVSCNQDNPENAAEACAMEESVMSEMHLQAVEQTLSRLQGLSDSMMDEQEAMAVVTRELGDMGYDKGEIQSIMAGVEEELNGFDHSAFDMMNGDDEPLGSRDDADALASAGHGSDEDYGDFGSEEFEEAFDLNNGYDDIENMDGSDFFPNGADGPVVKAVGPSGARQGDNPEQKKMQVAEVHKELVYGYRNFLKESTPAQKKS